MCSEGCWIGRRRKNWPSHLGRRLVDLPVIKRRDQSLVDANKDMNKYSSWYYLTFAKHVGAKATKRASFFWKRCILTEISVTCDGESIIYQNQWWICCFVLHTYVGFSLWKSWLICEGNGEKAWSTVFVWRLTVPSRYLAQKLGLKVGLWNGLQTSLSSFIFPSFFSM